MRTLQTKQELTAADRDRFFSLSLDMLCISSGDGYFKWLNPAFAQTLGWSIDELLTRPYVEFVHPDDLAATIREVERQVTAGEKVFRFENRYRHKDGSWRVLAWNSVPEGDLMYAVARDVTERNKLERALQETNAELEQRVSARTAALSSEIAERRKAEHKFRGILEAAPDAMIIVDETGRILLANQRVEGVFGYTSEELLGSSISKLLPQHNGDLPELRLGGSAQPTERRNAGSSRKELYAVHKDGSNFPIEISLSPDQLDEGPVVIAAVRDISDRRSVEMQLRQAQKMEAIGNLTGGMAHDFNNLLAIVIGNLDLLVAQRKDDKDVQLLAGEAMEASLRGADLTKRLLAFARRQPLQPKRIDLNEQIANITQLLRRTLSETIETRLDLDPALWPVVIDPAQLDASLTNLATNARDAMPKGGRLIIVTSNRHLDADYAEQYAEVTPGDYAMIEVSDSGTGMKPEIATRIFEPFFTTKERDKGTGLGLSMVFGFMKQSGGHISVYSEEGLGTTFRLFFPRATSGHDRDIPTVPATLARGGGETILAVEDNLSLRLVVARQLKELGYRVLEADDGNKALTILHNEPVDLLFTDIVMPGGMSGYDLAKAAMAGWPLLKVVLTSGFPDATFNGGVAPAAKIRLLSKPYRKDDLARALREVLDQGAHT